MSRRGRWLAGVIAVVNATRLPQSPVSSSNSQIGLRSMCDVIVPAPGDGGFGGQAEVATATGAFGCFAKGRVTWMQAAPPLTCGRQALEGGNRPCSRIPNKGPVGSDVDAPSAGLELSSFRHPMNQTNIRREVDKPSADTYRAHRRGTLETAPFVVRR